MLNENNSQTNYQSDIGKSLRKHETLANLTNHLAIIKKNQDLAVIQRQKKL